MIPVALNTRYTRSIQLERDTKQSNFVESYILTQRAIQTLHRISTTLNPSLSVPRAWALTGPYGSGKSAFAVFLTHLLGNSQHNATQQAIGLLDKTETDLCSNFKNAAQTNGYLVVAFTGSPARLGKAVLQALHQSLNNEPSNEKIINFQQKLHNVLEQKQYTLKEIILLINELQLILTGHYSGILLVIDELGKFLEFDARHSENQDSFLLQLLAEHASQPNVVPLQVVTLLHQSFEQYAGIAGEKLKNEWTKIAGRFESIAFLESTEQTLRILQHTFTQKFTLKDFPHLQTIIEKATHTLAEQSALPNGLSTQQAIELFNKCYPFHPITLLLLPTLCQKIAQNERTLFSYLASQEPYSFSHTLAQLDMTKIHSAFVMPHHLYDYFITNQSGTNKDFLTQRRWIEIISALERLQTTNIEVEQLLKTIGLFNLIGSQSGFKASPTLLNLCFNEAINLLQTLTTQSLITFRSYNNEHRIWQGSDFDLSSVLRDSIAKSIQLKLANYLNSYAPLAPILAKKHAFETGTLRYFTPFFIDYETAKTGIKITDKQSLLLFVAETPEQEAYFTHHVVTKYGKSNIYACIKHGAQLREWITEWSALEEIGRTESALAHDHVAHKEYEIYLSESKKRVLKALRELLDIPQNLLWYWKNQPYPIINKRSLQEFLTRVANELYHKTPHIKNELINRAYPSGTAISARNRLLEAMLNHTDEKDLGLDKYPPEKSIYLSILQKSGLHRPKQDNIFTTVWHFAPPEKDKDYCNLHPTWEKIELFFKKSEAKPISLTQLAQELSNAPYGLKAGLIPIIIITAYFVYQNELALYEDGNFVPLFRLDILERLRKSLDQFLLKEEKAQRIQITFSVQYFRMEGINGALLNEYVKLLQKSNLDGKTPDILSVVKPIAKFINGLPEYTQQTENLSDMAKSVRKVCREAQSPQELLFILLPKACGLDELNDDSSLEQTQQFSQRLIQAFRELNGAYPQLLSQLQSTFKQVFELSSRLTLEDVKATAIERYNDLELYAHAQEPVLPFLSRLTDKTGDAIHWLNRIFGLLANKPTEHWIDTDNQLAERKLLSFFVQLKDLELLRAQAEIHKKQSSKKFEAILLITRRQGQIQKHDVAFIDESSEKVVCQKVAELKKQLDMLEDKDIQKAVLALLLDQLLDFEKIDSNTV